MGHRRTARNKALAAAIFSFSLAFATLSIVAGWGIGRKKFWGRKLAIIVGLCYLPALPLGTALGIYTLVVMSSEDAKQAFMAASDRSNPARTAA